jgi:predicted RNA-binding Zn-ribbon protein involved in translation (DUF1610 family)
MATEQYPTCTKCGFRAWDEKNLTSHINSKHPTYTFATRQPTKEVKYDCPNSGDMLTKSATYRSATNHLMIRPDGTVYFENYVNDNA